nr:gIII coat protein fragment with maltose binding protein leader and synthetic leucine zipper [Cloning vector pZGT5]
MKIKTGARILALSALTTMMFSASALAKIEEGGRRSCEKLEAKLKELERKLAQLKRELKKLEAKLEECGSRGSGGGSGSGDFDYEKMANANKGAMTENADENALQSDAKGKLDSVATDYGAAIDGFIGDVSGLANGNGATGDFAGSNSQMAQVGDGDNSPLMNNFRQYLPSLPQSVECRPFVFGAGKPYEFSIDCDKINLFRGVFAFLLYVATFMYVFSTFANILRNKES